MPLAFLKDESWLQRWFRILLLEELFHYGKNYFTELETEQMSRSQGKSDKWWDSGKCSKEQKVTHTTVTNDTSMDLLQKKIDNDRENKRLTK